MEKSDGVKHSNNVSCNRDASKIPVRNASEPIGSFVRNKVRGVDRLEIMGRRNHKPLGVIGMEWYER